MTRDEVRPLIVAHLAAALVAAWRRNEAARRVEEAKKAVGEGASAA